MNHKENILALAKKCKDCKKVYETLVKCFGMDAPSYSTVTYHVRMYHFMNKKAPIIKIDKKSPDQTRTVNDILNDLNIKVRVEQKNEEIKTIMNENKDVNIDDKLAQSIVDGISDFEVHNDGGNMNLEKEVTLFTLFQAINSLPNHLINEAYDNVYNFCNLTENAKSNFEKACSRYAHLMTSPFVLVKILKLYQKEYYDEYVLPLLRKPKITFDIKLDDSFLITDIRRRAENHQYKNSSEVIEDLSRVIRFVDCGNKYFIQKDYNIHDKMNQISFVLQSNMKESLKMIKLFKEGR
ncbi:hypothetical protein TVAG_145780 [Trichomonas vaginalis G3]|uniref:Uncharacterized protein n=1 Tax=Trichomonas vaginalis (strain ATCC PRA-98 / G3) TaxID=412133 RepID=A2EFU7_TRIV3|nr:hypothetical protein TVAG_145780 [Trichomonas vaginalis G3]|eukprot:XP_001320721.1 hypothetical protein [Trichomonas vaginalis G3]